MGYGYQEHQITLLQQVNSAEEMLMKVEVISDIRQQKQKDRQAEREKMR